MQKIPSPNAFANAFAGVRRRSVLGAVLGVGCLGLPAWADDGLQTLWNTTLPSPDGTPTAMRQFSGTPLIVNFWATWCAPCVQELPLLNEFHKQQAKRAQGLRVVGIAIDSPQKVQPFVQRLGLDFPILVAGNQGMGLSKKLGNPGGLPFTLVLGAGGAILDRKSGMVHTPELARWSEAAG